MGQIGDAEKLLDGVMGLEDNGKLKAYKYLRSSSL